MIKVMSTPPATALPHSILPLIAEGIILKEDHVQSELAAVAAVPI